VSAREKEQHERWTAVHQQVARNPGQPTRDPLPLGNRTDPDEELIYLLLTLMTRSQAAIEHTHVALPDLAGSPPWAALQHADTAMLQQLLQPVGLVKRRSTTLRSLGATVTQQHGGTLRALRRSTTRSSKRSPGLAARPQDASLPISAAGTCLRWTSTSSGS